MSNLVHNERIKLYATFCNNIAVAAVVVGAVLRLFNASESSPVSVVIVFGCLFFGIACFGIAHATLGSLKE